MKTLMSLIVLGLIGCKDQAALDQLAKCQGELIENKTEITKLQSKTCPVCEDTTRLKAQLAEFQAQEETRLEQGLMSRLLVIEKLLNRRIVDEKGIIIDRPQVLKDLRVRYVKSLGDNERLRRALIDFFGIKTGIEIYNAR